MVRVEINCAGIRQITACLRFPINYPESQILLELKSKTLSQLLLTKLTSIAENEAKAHSKKPQILPVIRFIKKFLDDNRLCVCYDEISAIKKLLASNDKIKLNQSNSKISFTLTEGSYFLNLKVVIPEEYYHKSISVVDSDSNFPAVLERFLLAQAQVIARQCVEPSSLRLVKFKGGKERLIGGKIIRAPAASSLPFCPSPSLEKVVSFLIKTVRQIVKEHCQICKKQCLPDDPAKAQYDSSADDHVERVYCGHLFHLHCLLTYMKTPPFQGGKKCPTCGELVCHDKWRLTERLAEDRWAHEQARERELKEVAEFFE